MTDIASIIALMGERPIAYNPIYRHITGSTSAAILLSQLIYWDRVTAGDWFYKSAKEWEQETGLTVKEQDTARKRLVSLGFLLEKKRGVPCRLFFKLSNQAVCQAIIEYANRQKSTHSPQEAQMGEKHAHFAPKTHDTDDFDTQVVSTHQPNQKSPKSHDNANSPVSTKGRN